MIKYIQEANEVGCAKLQELDIYSIKKILILAEVLKMRELERTLLTVVTMQMLDRENVVDFLNLSYSKSVQRKMDYRNEEIIESESDDEDDDGGNVDEQEAPEKAGPRIYHIDVPLDENDQIESLKDSEENWTEFYNYCIDLTANNLPYIMKTQ